MERSDMKDLDKYKGCLIGGAAGDALGYVVEFLDEPGITGKYGSNGITEYDLANMGSYPSYIAYCYKEWYQTQTERYPLECKNGYHYTWLSHIPELFERRAPGMTCLSAIEKGCNGTMEEPANNSKGCGGVMRVAPIGLYFIDNKHYEPEEVMLIGAQTAALTHGHELGYIPAAALVHIIRCLAQEGSHSVLEAVNESLSWCRILFSKAKHLREFEEIMGRAIRLSSSGMDDIDAIHALGEGWVAEETLAIAVYCALKYPTDIEKGLTAAVNHKGDSDSTGAVAGNIIGANVGLSGIPQKFISRLELRNMITGIAEDLYHDCPMQSEYDMDNWSWDWEHKYIKNDYPVWKAGKGVKN